MWKKKEIYYHFSQFFSILALAHLEWNVDTIHIEVDVILGVGEFKIVIVHSVEKEEIFSHPF